jgi:hypothetical protein
MNFSEIMAADIKGARAELTALREKFMTAAHELPGLQALVMDLQHHGIALAAYLSSIEATAAAGRMVGNLEPSTRQEAVETLPLFLPAAGPPAAALLRSLHRAGDHTLDPES